MDADESRIAELEAELVDKDTTISMLLGNISDMEEELDAVDDVIQMYYMMIVDLQNQITALQEGESHSRGMNDFSYLNFENAELFSMGDILLGSIWEFTDLRNASLGYADFTNASFVSANLAGANGVFATFHHTDFSSASMYNGIWRQSDFTNAVFVQSNLAYTDFRWSDLSGANLSGAVMYGGSNWMGTNLSHADLTNAWLYDVDLRGADLTGADLTGARLTYLNPSYGPADITGVTWDWAICPDGTAAYYHGQTCEDNLDP